MLKPGLGMNGNVVQVYIFMRKKFVIPVHKPLTYYLGIRYFMKALKETCILWGEGESQDKIHGYKIHIFAILCKK